MPNIVKLFALTDEAVRAMLKADGSRKMCRDGSSHHAMSNGIEEFKANNGFDNDLLEIYMAQTNQ